MALWRRTSACFLIGLTTWFTFSKSLVWIWFNANRKALAETHCINRNRPELKCHGACYFGKLVAPLDETQQPREASSPAFPKTPEFPLCAHSFSPIIPTLSSQKFYWGDYFLFLNAVLLTGPPSPPPELA